MDQLEVATRPQEVETLQKKIEALQMLQTQS